MIKLSIIVLNYNTKDLLIQTLSSINRQAQWEIIVVDNASTDGSSDAIKKKFPDIKLIINHKNNGFAGGNNIGINIARGEYIMLLNSDTKVMGPALEELTQYLDANPGVGVVSPKVTLPDGAIDLACHRGFPTLWNAFAYFAKLEQTFPNFHLFSGYHQAWQDFNTTHEVDAVSGAAMVVRRQAIDQVGLLDENFFLYAEDLDWCKRIKDAGWKIVYYPKATILHFKSQSGRAKAGSEHKQVKSASRTQFFLTMKQYYDKHYPHHPKIVRGVVHLLGDLLERIKK